MLKDGTWDPDRWASAFQLTPEEEAGLRKAANSGAEGLAIIQQFLVYYFDNRTRHWEEQVTEHGLRLDMQPPPSPVRPLCEG